MSAQYLLLLDSIYDAIKYKVGPYKGGNKYKYISYYVKRFPGHGVTEIPVCSRC